MKNFIPAVILILINMYCFAQSMDTVSISGYYKSFIIVKHISITSDVFSTYNPNFDNSIISNGKYNLILPKPLMEIFKKEKYPILNECIRLKLNRESHPEVSLNGGKFIIFSSRFPRTVPQGKKWTLPTNQELIIELSNQTFQSGTACWANILSDPRFLSVIIEGEIGFPKALYTILFKDIERVPYANNETHVIKPISIVDHNFNIYELKEKTVEEVGFTQITFYPGQKIFLDDCIKSIQLIETDYQKIQQTKNLLFRRGK